MVCSNEILTEVTPPPRTGARMSFEKLRPRGVWDFAMAALAINLHIERDVVQDARIVFGGIAGRPVRETSVENALKGQRLGPAAIDQAQGVALASAAPLRNAP